VNRKTSKLKHIAQMHTALALPQHKCIIAQYVRQLLTILNALHAPNNPRIVIFLHSMKVVVTKM